MLLDQEPAASVPSGPDQGVIEEARRRQRRRWRAVAVALLGGAVAGVLLLEAGGSGPTSPHSRVGRAPAQSHAPANTSRERPVIPTLAGSSVLDLSWNSPKDGWALLKASCGAEVACARIARTTNSGRSWRALANPLAGVVEVGWEGGCALRACVSEVRFATPSIGYLFGPSLLMTRNGGRSWTLVASSPVESLEPGAGGVVRLVYNHGGCPGPCERTLEAASAGSEHWRVLLRGMPTLAPSRAGRANLIRAGANTIYVPIYGDLAAGAGSQQTTIYRSLDNGRSWTALPDPCGPLVDARTRGISTRDATALAAAPGGFLAALCTARASEGVHFLVTSKDYGRTWGPRLPIPAWAPAYQIAASSPTRLVLSNGDVSGTGSYNHSLIFSNDGGRHWSTVASEHLQLQEEASVPSYLEFESSEVGHWISSPHVIWTTRDGGAHWVRRPFP